MYVLAVRVQLFSDGGFELTHVTLVRSLSLVRFPMHLHAAFGAESFLTNVTSRTFGSLHDLPTVVYPTHVQTHFVLTHKQPLANFTLHVFLDWGVSTLAVALEVVRTCCSVRALFTLVNAYALSFLRVLL